MGIAVEENRIVGGREKKELFCMQIGQAIKTISETHHIKIKGEKWEIKDDVR